MPIPQPRNNLEALYNTASETIELGSFPEFMSRMAEPENRKAFFDFAGQDFDLGTPEEFEGRIAPYYQSIQAPVKPKNSIEEYQQAVERITKGFASFGGTQAVTARPMSTDTAIPTVPPGEKIGPEPEVWGPDKPPAQPSFAEAPERGTMERIGDFFKKPFTQSPEEKIARAQNVLAISKQTGLSIPTIENNYKNAIEHLGLKSGPSGAVELAEGLMIAPIAAGMMSNPVTTAIGLAGYMGLSEIESGIISKIQGAPYRFGEQKGLSELLPEESSQGVGDFVDILDFVGKGLLIGGIYRKAPAIAEKFTKNVVEEYGLPKEVYINPDKVKSIFQTGEKISPEEAEMVKDLGLSGNQYRTALKTGVNIRVPAERIVKITDKPYWAKLKGAIGLKPFKKVTKTEAGKPTAGFPEAEVPSETLPPKQLTEGMRETKSNIVQQLRNENKIDTIKFAKNLKGILPPELIQPVVDGKISFEDAINEVLGVKKYYDSKGNQIDINAESLYAEELSNGMTEYSIPEIGFRSVSASGHTEAIQYAIEKGTEELNRALEDAIAEAPKVEPPVEVPPVEPKPSLQETGEPAITPEVKETGKPSAEPKAGLEEKSETRPVVEKSGQVRLLEVQKQMEPTRIIAGDYREAAAQDKSANTNLFNTQKFEGEKQTSIETAKEPWEMTREEYDRSRATLLGYGAELSEQNRIESGETDFKNKTIWRQPKAPSGTFTHELRHIVAHEAEKTWNELRNYDLSFEDAQKVSTIIGIDRSLGYDGLKYRREFKDELVTRIAQGDERIIKEFPDVAKIIQQHPERLRPDISLKPHKEMVKDALASGKPVPPEVLAEYPDLKLDAPTAIKETAKGVNKVLGGIKKAIGNERGVLDVSFKRSAKESKSNPLSDKELAEFEDAIRNTAGAKLTENGLELDIARYQKPEQFGEESIRTGVFYLPEQKSPYAKYYSTGKMGYGGGERISGRTTIRFPFITKAGTGGKAIERAYDKILGKGSYEKMRSDVLKSAWKSMFNREPDSNAIRELLKKYGGKPDLTEEIIRNSTKGNQLPYAIQEHIAAHTIRKAGYDAVLSYSTSGGKPRLSELYDVRASNYPDETTSFEYPDFYDALKTTVKGINELFGGKRIGAKAGFTEEDYRQAKPHFDRAWEAYKAAGKSLKDYVYDLIKRLGGKFQQLVNRWKAEVEKAVKSEKGVLDVTYQKAVELAKNKPPKPERVKKDARAIISDSLVPISTTLEIINPELKYALRRLESNTHQSIKNDTESALPFLKAKRKMSKNDQVIYDLAQKNGDIRKFGALTKKYGFEDELDQTRRLLDDLFNRAKAAGYSVNYLPNYFPRILRDKEGFLNYLYGTDDWGMISEAIKERESTLERVLSLEEKADLANSIIRGYGRKISLTAPDNLQPREIAVLDENLNQFYFDSDQSLLMYIDNIVRAVELRKFFGKEKKTPKGQGPLFGDDPKEQLDNSIGAYVARLLEEGKITPKQENELRGALMARFNYRMSGPAISAFKNIGYIQTMGNIGSTITQFGDLAYGFYEGGAIQATKALGKAIRFKSEITPQSLGIGHIAEEFRDPNKLGKALQMIFKAIGFNKLDSVGKETLMNSAIGKLRAQAKSGKIDREMMQELKYMFGDKVDVVIEELKSGELTDNVRFIAFNTVLDFQPLALSEMPKNYLENPKGRVLYMLKTFTIKYLDVMRREAIRKIRSNDPETKKRGYKNLMRLAGWFVLFNASADVIKDFIFGRDISLPDLVVDNALRLFAISKYIGWQARDEGISSALIKTVAPPFDFIDLPAKDIDETIRKIAKGDEVKIKDFRSWKMGPGKHFYWLAGRGATTQRRERRQDMEKEAAKRKFSTDEENELMQMLDEAGESGELTLKGAFQKKREFNKNQSEIGE